MKFLIVGFLLLLNLNFYAENISTTTLRTEKKQSDLIKKIKYKLIRLINPQRAKLVMAVAAIRGNNYDSTNGLYWKTKNSDKLNERIESEKKIMDGIIKMVDDGKIDDAKKELSDFIKNNPKSFFIDDAKKLLEEIDTSQSDNSLVKSTDSLK
jgi:TolA-binding protein